MRLQPVLARPPGRLSKWRTALVVLLTLTLELGTLAIPTALGQAPTLSGVLLSVRGSEIQRLDLGTRDERSLLRVPGALVTRVAHAPDRNRIAYTVTYYDQNFALGRSEIIVANPDGSNAQPALTEADPGFLVSGVTWTHDPRRLLYVKANGSRTVERIEEVDLDSGARTLVVEAASAPSASPAAPLLAFQTRTGNVYDVQRLDRRAETRGRLLPPAWFEDIDRPTFSPDGDTVAFVAVGPGPTGASSPELSRLFAVFQPRPAAAHDLPGALFDLWTISPSGDNLRRVAPLFDANPEIAWSPDGRFIAAAGSFQLQVVDVAAGVSHPIPRPAGSSPQSASLSWGTR